MFNFILFALLATNLFTTATAVASLRRERKELVYSSHLLDSVIKLEKELEASYVCQSDLQADIADLNQQLQAEHYSVECYKLMHETELSRADKLENQLLAEKEMSSNTVQSMQAEIYDLEDQVRDQAKEIKDLNTRIKRYVWDLEVYSDVCNPNEFEAGERLADALVYINALEKKVDEARALGFEQDLPF